MRLKLTHRLPRKLNRGAVERAVSQFIQEVDVKGNPIGFNNQTIHAIHNALKGGGDFWLAVDDDGEVAAYCLGHITTEIDFQLTYWLSQAWVRPTYRHTPQVKDWWGQLRTYAIEQFCKHIIVVSGRGVKGYCRFLGKGWEPYATLLKEDI